MKGKPGFRKKNVLKLAIFLLMVAGIGYICVSTLGFADAQKSEHVMEDFYDLEENTVDCVFLGPSVVQRGSVVPEAWHKYGIASYSLASGTQPFLLTRYLMEEAQKTQDPKLFVIELKNICKGPDDIGDVAIRRIVDNMKPSLTRLRAINELTEYAKNGENTVDTTGMSYYFPFMKYHSRWNPSLKPDVTDYIDYYNGYSIDLGFCFWVNEIHPLDSTDRMEPIDKENEKVLNDLLDYCDTIDARVIFRISPYEATEKGAGKLNYAKSIVEKRGYDCLSFISKEDMEKAGLDTRTCYYNQEHLNYYGAVKLTDYMSALIQKEYGIEDRRGQKGYEDYDRLYDRFAGRMNTAYAEEYENMMKKINKVEGRN